MSLKRVFSLFIVAFILQLVAVVSFAQKHLLPVTSQIPSLPSGQMTTVKGTGFLVIDCGRPTCSDSEYSDKRLASTIRSFVITASHVGSGQSPQILIQNSPAQIIGQWNDFKNDITVFEVARTGVFPLAVYYHNQTHHALIAPLFKGFVHRYTLEKIRSINIDSIMNFGRGYPAHLTLPSWIRETPRGFGNGMAGGLQYSTKLERGIAVPNFVTAAQSLPGMSGAPAFYLESRNQIDGVPSFSALTPYDQGAAPQLFAMSDEEHRGTAWVLFGMVTRALNVQGPQGQSNPNDALSFFTGNAAITKVLNKAIRRQASEHGQWNLWRGYYCYNTNEEATCFFREGPVGNGMIVEGYQGPDKILSEQNRSNFNKSLEQLSAGVPHELGQLPNAGVLKEIRGSLKRQNPSLQFLKIQ